LQKSKKSVKPKILKPKKTNGNISSNSNKPTIIKPSTKSTKVSGQKQVNKPIIKTTKAVSGKGGYVSPEAMVSDITKTIKNLSPKNVNTIARQLSSKL